MTPFPQVLVATGPLWGAPADAIVVNCVEMTIRRGDIWIVAPRARGRLKMLEWGMMSCLVCARGRIVAWADVVNMIYGDREDGGPVAPVSVLHVMKSRLLGPVWGARLAFHGIHGFGIGLRALPVRKSIREMEHA